MTTLFGNVEVTTVAPTEAPRQKKKHSLLPVLTVLFCVSYGLMTMLIVEQGRTIDSQRALIRELFRDSVTLNGYKMKALEEKRAATNAQTPSAKGALQTPSTQDQNQTPSSQAAPQHRTPNQNVQPRQYQSTRPASDQAFDREALIRS